MESEKTKLVVGVCVSTYLIVDAGGATRRSLADNPWLVLLLVLLLMLIVMM